MRPIQIIIRSKILSHAKIISHSATMRLIQVISSAIYKLWKQSKKNHQQCINYSESKLAEQ